MSERTAFRSEKDVNEQRATASGDGWRSMVVIGGQRVVVTGVNGGR